MSDLIEREDAIRLFLKRKNELAGTQGDLGGAMSGAAKLIESLPSAEPKQGKWVDIVEMDSGGYPFKVGVCCSVCGFETLSEDNYCSSCGAKMR